MYKPHFAYTPRLRRIGARPLWLAWAAALAFALLGCEQDAMRQQSPVNIAGYADGGAPVVEFAYGGSADNIVNDGDFVRVKYANGGGIRIDGREYELIEMHAHNPSEHTIDGESFDLETHLVHKRASGEIAVVGILYRLGEPNLVMRRIIEAAPAQGEADIAPPAPLQATDYLPTSGGYYAYHGSLTTPPYTEGVQWIVMADALQVSSDQVRQLAALTGGVANNRPTQPLNGRNITTHGIRADAAANHIGAIAVSAGACGCPGCCAAIETAHASARG